MKTVAENRRARFDFEILETLEAGLILSGQEVKSCRAGHVNLAGAYVSFHTGSPVLRQVKIAPYAYASDLKGYDPAQDRSLLLSRNQLLRLQKVTAEEGQTVIPLEVRVGKYVKILLGIARGRKRWDKRARIKEREVQRRLKRGEEM